MRGALQTVADSPCWRLQLLDGVRLETPDGRALALKGRVAALLLARLALPPRRPLAREEVVEALWPGADPAVARNRLRQLLSQLRATLLQAHPAPLLHADRHTVGLRPGALCCDLDDPRADGELLPGHYADWVIDARRERAARRLPPPTPRLALPHPLTRWRGDPAGRDRLCSLVRATRLVTIVGPGGCGKTRLALEAAHALSDAFERIVWVPLAASHDAATLLEQCVGALGTAGRTDTLQALHAALADRRILLLLDNLEQLPADAVALLGQLAEGLPRLHLLSTSRRALALDGEHLFELPPLGHPLPRDDLATMARHPAMALLLDRVQAVQPTFRLDAGNAAALVALLRQLDGLPLAIELVAPRLRSIAPAALLPMLQGPGATLALLARDGPRNGHDARHASMLDTLRWSFTLLSTPARTLLEAVSVLDGPFDAAAAEALVGAPAALALGELVDHSLLHHAAGRWPFTLHPLTREALQQGLPASRRAALRAALRRWAAGWAAALPAQPPLPEVRQVLPNLVAAIVSAEADAAPATALEIFHGLQRALSDMPLPASAREALLRCAAQLPSADDRAVARAALARAAMRAGDGAQALAIAGLALQELPPAGRSRAFVLARVAHLRWRLRRDAGVGPWLDEALALARAHRDDGLVASVLSTQGAMCRVADPAAAAALHAAAIAAWRAAGDGHGSYTGRYNLAMALGAEAGTRDRALRENEAVIAAAEAAGDWGLLATAWNQRGELMRALRRWDEAVLAYRTAIRTADDAFDPLTLAYALWNLPLALVRRREARAAVQLMAFAQRHWVAQAGALSAEDLREVARLRRQAARVLGPVQAGADWRAGEAMRMAAALRLALAAEPPP